MKAILIVAAVLCGLTGSAAAQAGGGSGGEDGQAAALLAHAKYLYGRRELDRALPLLRELVAPGQPMEVTLAQRVDAYKYLGAAHALAGRRDSAITHFGTALAWDPFTSVEPPEFTREQASMFVEARRRMFAVALRPIAATRVELRNDSVKFTAVATHLARVRVALIRSDSVRIPLYEGEMDGARVFAWSGMDRRGNAAPPGRYRVSIVAQSRVMDWQDSTWAHFNVAYELPAQEMESAQEKTAVQPAAAAPPPASAPQAPDSARTAIPDRNTEPRPQKGAGGDVVKAFAIATGALLVGGLVANDHLGGGRSEARIVAGLATVAGVIAVLRSRSKPPPAPPRALPPRPPVRTPPPVVKRPEPVTPPPVATRRSRAGSRPVLLITPSANLEP